MAGRFAVGAAGAGVGLLDGQVHHIFDQVGRVGPLAAPTCKEQVMTLIPISNLSQAEIHILRTNAVVTARRDCEINAVNGSLAVYNEQVEKFGRSRARRTVDGNGIGLTRAL